MFNFIKKNRYMADLGVALVYCIGIGIMVALVARVAAAPIIYQAYPDGQVCGCQLNGNMPTLSQCAYIDKNKLHEVVYMGNCKGGK